MRENYVSKIKNKSYYILVYIKKITYTYSVVTSCDKNLSEFNLSIYFSRLIKKQMSATLH